MILLGNKVDLDNRVVTKNEAIDYENEKGLLYPMVDQILDSRVDRVLEKKENNFKIQLSNTMKQFKREREIIKLCC